MEIVIHGHNLPGRDFRNAGVPIHNVHVGLQVRREPTDLVRGDAKSAEWHLDVRVEVADDGTFDFKGPAVQGTKGQRFLYLTWGDVGLEHNTFAMFRRAKLMLADVDRQLIRTALDRSKPLQARVDLTDEHGCPRCARMRRPALVWSV